LYLSSWTCQAAGSTRTLDFVSCKAVLDVKVKISCCAALVSNRMHGVKRCMHCARTLLCCAAPERWSRDSGDHLSPYAGALLAYQFKNGKLNQPAQAGLYAVGLVALDFVANHASNTFGFSAGNKRKL